jgi:dTDP-4-dehydrorhamnose reductase
MAQLELWGGPECTVNRVGDGYRDQSVLSGHHDRLNDLDLFAGLGLKAIRYPVLWERIAPHGSDAADWRWTDERLPALRQRGIRSIAGLTHHGSGPAHTNLLDPGFAAGLAGFALRVAQRYDWIEDWTPVNEPLTTARFSALYGHWYPHHRDEASFWLALVNQVDGVRMAMKAVRQVNPNARLIQTDDLGRTYSTVKLGEQAAFDNLRRWAGWDLLFGHVTRHHPLWQRIARAGLSERLIRIADDPCPPDIVGVNHYLTSDRFLDHRLQFYPPQTHGGNRTLSYADTEAIRVLEPAPAGLAGALREAWQRYRVPLAITEVHNGCTREEQMRWAADAWDTAEALRSEGIDIRGVTAWSLLGSHGWNTLLTTPGVYEPGVFDVSTGTPRPTALAPLWKGLPLGAPRHPVTAGMGWWRRPDRITGRPIARPASVVRPSGSGDVQPLLICGATGTLGQAFARACVQRDIAHVVTDRSALDLERPDDIAEVLNDVRPWAVVNATGWVRVDDAESHEAACYRANASGAIALAEACAARGIGYLGFSSDLVFDGEADRAYCESDTPRPLSAYGRSKVAMEEGCATLPGALVVRTAAFFSPWDQHNFAAAVVRSLLSNEPFAAADDYVVTPSFVPHLVDAALDLLIDGTTGIWHLANDEAVSWADFARRIAAACGLDPKLVRPVPGSSLGWLATRPQFAGLSTERGASLPSLDRAIDAFASEAMAPGVVRQCA